MKSHSDHPALDNINLASLWRRVSEDGDTALEDYLTVGYITRLDKEGSTYAYIFGRRIGAFTTPEDARRAIQDRIRALMEFGDITFEAPNG